ncbi:MAG: WecB/TagA/CpsF family glycosyltransferase [Patescibacteria group bacterium]|jgi:N-acetylglucosaminyldiphosphoundecaprenol N-acetyl-beta-D-mannosaminyltransferase
MKILGVRVDNYNLDETLNLVKGYLTDNRQHLIATVNPEMVVLAQKDLTFREVLNATDLNLPDGFGVILASWFLGDKLKERITGVDFVWQICALAEKLDKSVYLLGGQVKVGEAAAAKISKNFPRLKIFSGGNDCQPTDPAIIQDLSAKKPHIILAAFGHGRQEKWLAENLPRLPFVDIGLGVGGAFDFIAGKIKRAPKFLRQLGLEWLWRLILQPWRWQRILTATGRFSWLVVKARFLNN